MVQLPEPTPDESVARQEGYSTIAELSRERIRLAGRQIVGDGAQLDLDGPLDTGFRSFSLVDTNFSKWRLASDIDAVKLEQHLLGLRDSASDDAGADDLLTEILLKQGYSLTEQISDRKVESLPLKVVGDGVVLAYLDEHNKPTLEQLRKVVEQKPARFIILEDSFHGDDELKTNLVQECKARGVELWTA